MKQLIVKSVPEELHRKFKAYCVYNDVTMSDAIKEFMMAATAKTVVKTGTAQTILTGETIVTLGTEEETEEGK